MKYVNGRDVFPERLLRQIQKYVSGQLVYIPSREQKRSWGESSGYKRHLWERNRMIRAQFQEGKTVDMLAEENALSPESIRRILYDKKEDYMMEYECTLFSAQESARHNQLEEWVHAYLLSDGHNREFSDGLKLFDRFFLGPMRMPLSLFQRCCGPEEGMRWHIDEKWFNPHVEELMQAIQKKGEAMPPLIVHYLIGEGKTEGEFELNDGNHRLEAYRRLGIEDYWVIVWITEKAEYNQFMQRYGKYLEK